MVPSKNTCKTENSTISHPMDDPIWLQFIHSILPRCGNRRASTASTAGEYLVIAAYTFLELRGHEHRWNVGYCRNVPDPFLVSRLNVVFATQHWVAFWCYTPHTNIDELCFVHICMVRFKRDARKAPKGIPTYCRAEFVPYKHYHLQ